MEREESTPLLARSAHSFGLTDRPSDALRTLTASQQTEGRSVVLVAAISNASARSNFARLLEELQRPEGSTWSVDFRSSVVAEPDLSNAALRLSTIFGSGSTAAILVSDKLSERGQPTAPAREILDRFRSRPLATLSITPAGRRTPEIDRSIRSDIGSEGLRRALELLCGRLAYVMPPEKKPGAERVQVRRITSQAELQSYFRLRHSAYVAMGYLDLLVESARTRLEIDVCDHKSLHLGAFLLQECRRELVGTARIVSTRPFTLATGQWVQELVDRDPALRIEAHERSLPLQLPVFQSQEKMNDYIAEATIHGVVYGELSRVIVRGDFRGLGISHDLVDTAIDESRRAGIQRLLLECMELHAPLYEKHGFARLPGMRGRVIGIGRTMIPMLLRLD